MTSIGASGKPAKGNGSSPVTQKEKRDVAIMGTNNSSIVSKRSVERLYAKPDEHRFFRYFVKKPQRRSPLINRGYWLRMQAVEYVVRSFLAEETSHEGGSKPKVVVNLGCGYDPLPFQCLSSTTPTSSVTYVDIDYPDLIAFKAKVISQTPELASLLSEAKHHEPASDHVHYRSKEYLALGCDLRDLGNLQRLVEAHGLYDSAILFTAEVALTYMDQEAVDALIAWAGLLPDARFSILEQFLPAGATHPFAKTMIRHFNSLSTPLKSISTYPTLHSQIQRFSTRGWNSVDACDLLAFWTTLITPEQKAYVESVEPFDEWEEFYLFCQHYFILYACTATASEGPFRGKDSQIRWIGGEFLSVSASERPPLSHSPNSDDLRMESVGVTDFTPSPLLRRRFGATAPYGDGNIFYSGGLGSTTRLGTSLLISSDSSTLPFSFSHPPRMCHTLTRLSPTKLLLVGGRTSPDRPLSDCWIYESGKWRRVQDLPEPRFRHSVAPLNETPERIILFGGKGIGGKLVEPWLIWEESTGWKEVPVDAERPPAPRFASSICWTTKNYGILTGGLEASGNVFGDMWYLELSPSGVLHAKLSLMDLHSTHNLWRRFGGELVYVGGGTLFLVGGVSGNGCLRSEQEVLEIKCDKFAVYPVNVGFGRDGKGPLLVGHQVEVVGGSMIVAGGGGVCFSFGACNNDGIWTVKLDGNVEKTVWKITEEGKAMEKKSEVKIEELGSQGAIGEIKRAKIESKEDFAKIMKAGIPVVLEGLDFGECVGQWDPKYLKEKVGGDRKVTVHDSRTTHMSFHTKNFSYIAMSFENFIDNAFSPNPTSHLYLRSLSTSNPTSKPTNLADDFPELAKDFVLPLELEFVQTHQHSSPLRISSANTGMWLHFDVCSNILFHIRGQKQFRLYPPSDLPHLSFPHGASSSTIPNIFAASPPTTNPIETILNPGDAIFIPQLWLHASMPLTPCVAVNVFFRNLEEAAYAAGRDVYANRDLAAYEYGRKAIARMLDELGKLPSEVGKFYGRRLAEELRERVEE